MVVTAAVAGAALAGGLVTLAGSGTAANAGGVRTIVLSAHHSRFEPDRIRVKPGTQVRFVIHNLDPIEHEFIIGPPEVHEIHEHGRQAHHHGDVPGEISLPAGGTAETTWTFGPSGTVAYGCHLPGHWAYGMHGQAEVR